MTALRSITAPFGMDVATDCEHLPAGGGDFDLPETLGDELAPAAGGFDFAGQLLAGDFNGDSLPALASWQA